MVTGVTYINKLCKRQSSARYSGYKVVARTEVRNMIRFLWANRTSPIKIHYPLTGVAILA